MSIIFFIGAFISFGILLYNVFSDVKKEKLTTYTLLLILTFILSYLAGLFLALTLLKVI